MKYALNNTSEENIPNRYLESPTTNTKMVETRTYDVGVTLEPF